jgi:hypothetical protein
MISRRNFISGLAAAVGLTCAPIPKEPPPQTLDELIQHKMEPGLDPWFKLASFVTDKGVLRIDHRKRHPNKATFMPFSPGIRLDNDPWRWVEIRMMEIVEDASVDPISIRYIFHLEFNDGKTLQATYRPML